jgi:hypothetical protein
MFTTLKFYYNPAHAAYVLTVVLNSFYFYGVQQTKMSITKLNLIVPTAYPEQKKSLHLCRRLTARQQSQGNTVCSQQSANPRY